MGKKEKAPVNPLYGKNIVRLREERGWKQNELARRLRYKNASYLNTIEKGERSPGIGLRKRLCDLFKVGEGELTRSESEWGVTRGTDSLKYKQEEVKPYKAGVMVPGSYGTPPLPHQVVELDVPTREDARKRLVDQLDEVLSHQDQTFIRAITANLEAFSKAAESEARIAALEKEVEELRLQVKILSDRATCEAPAAYAAIKKQGEQNDGGQP